MPKKFVALIAVYDHVMPTWVKWDLITVVSVEQYQELAYQTASKYRISDGKKATELWIILDREGFYQRASRELEEALDNLYCSHHSPRRQSIIANPTKTVRGQPFSRLALSNSR